MTRKIAIAALVAVFSLLSVGAFAQGSMSMSQMRDIKSACKADVKAYCGSVEPGGGRLVMCLKDNENSISAKCKQMIDSLIKQQQAN
ncbi:cysteine rich repeat-containing protein [uncultured Cohaesibacter sp.]|uniref:cysteine rich repeat-containing protein n=1 Tax=uncultured Cohaesibacter sp. TaxID=1002546 RepID=UPI0029C96D01|nr:cysteine rich repeat-containing protein [uncultured Cohaesibacter sp.]